MSKGLNRGLKCIAILAIASCCIAPVFCRAQDATLADWPRLVQRGKCQEARRLCTEYIYSSDMHGKVESQKCLAQVELCGNGEPVVPAASSTGAASSGGYKPEAVDAALGHLDIAQKLAPQDIYVYLNRLHILEISGRYSDMPPALEDACNIYTGSDALTAWLEISDQLMDQHQYKVGLEFAQLIDKHYPNSAMVNNAIGTFLVLLGRSSEAIPYLARATTLAPKDGGDAWSLARAYDATDQLDLANRWYKKALPMMKTADDLRDNTCTYAHFIEAKLHDRQHACSMEKISCDGDQQTACARQPDATATSASSQSK